MLLEVSTMDNVSEGNEYPIIIIDDSSSDSDSGDDDDDDDDDEEEEEKVAAEEADDDGKENKIRVGEDYQAVVPALRSEKERKEELDEQSSKELLLWSPNRQTVSDSEVDSYVHLAETKYGYNTEQALGMLFWHDGKLEGAVKDLPNFLPFSETWSLDEKIQFENAFQSMGKNFYKIHKMIPDKPVPKLIEYYYKWKKVKTRNSHDRSARKYYSSVLKRSENGNTKTNTNIKYKSSSKQTEIFTCASCGVLFNAVNKIVTNKGLFCKPCISRLK